MCGGQFNSSCNNNNNVFGLRLKVIILYMPVNSMGLNVNPECMFTLKMFPLNWEGEEKIA